LRAVWALRVSHRSKKIRGADYGFKQAATLRNKLIEYRLRARYTLVIQQLFKRKEKALLAAVLGYKTNENITRG
jgi:hypothetical protein